MGKYLVKLYSILISIIILINISIIFSQKAVPVAASGGRVKAPKKAAALGLSAAAPASTRTGGAAAYEQQPVVGGVTSIFDVYNCSYYNDQLCRNKLDELRLEYCYCYEDSLGNILICGYKYDYCKPPKFF